MEGDVRAVTQPGIGRARVARNTGWNLTGLGLPALVAFAAIPLLIRELGAERFGVLALVWGLVGYFTFLDMGLGNAVTRAASRRVGKPGARWIPMYAWAGVLTACVPGIVAGGVIAALAPWVVRSVMNVPPNSMRKRSQPSRWWRSSCP
jgi:O-antigen/teichoic acid export membrane protein